MKYDVFISYSSKDQKVVEAMCAYLEQHRVRCFVAYRDIPKGVVWAKAIVEALDESAMMVVVFSEEFNLSDQVDREIELASEDKKPILTYRISDAMFKGAKKYYLKNLNWIDAFPNPEPMFDSLLDNVCRLIGRPLIDVNTKPVSNNPASVPVAKPAKKSISAVPAQEAEPVQKQVPAPKSASGLAEHLSESVRRILEDEKKMTWKVGDYYDVDGKEGVVFWVDETGKHGKIVSLDEAELRWCTEKEFKKGTAATDKSDGMKNLQSIMNISDWRNKYPTFAWCADHGTGWYLPAIEELKELLLNDVVHDKVNETLKKNGKSVMSSKSDMSSIKSYFSYYWSSTEFKEWFAWSVGMGDGNTIGDGKYNLYYVRAVSAF